MLLVRVFVDSGLVPPFDPRPYPLDWHMHHDGERYLAIVLRHCREVGAPEPGPQPGPQPGDIVVFRYGRCYAHGGIVTVANPLTIVHAFSPARVVLEEPVARNAVLSQAIRKPRVFSHWRDHEATAP